MSLKNTDEDINLEVPITDITDSIIYDLDVIKTPNKPGNLEVPITDITDIIIHDLDVIKTPNKPGNIAVPITDITDIIIHDLDVIKTPNKPGNLVNLNLNDIKTTYNFTETAQFYLNDLNSLRGRGRHSNINVREIIVCVSGSCTISLFNCYEKKHILIQPNQAVFIPNNIWIDLYNFKQCVLLVLVEKTPVDLNDSTTPIKQSIYNLTEYLNFNKIDSNFRDIYFKDYLIIDHVIPIFWKSKCRYIHTKNIFKYYQDLRNILFYSHNIILTFTIVGSNNAESLELYENNLKCDNGIFHDIYIEYDQQSKYPGNLMMMLHDKWVCGFEASFIKTSNIIVLRGSNDVVEPKIYVQIKEQYYKGEQNKLYIASKSVPHINLSNISLIMPTTFSETTGTICYNDNKYNILCFDNQYHKNHYSFDFVASIGTIGFIGLTKNTWQHIFSLLNTNPGLFNIANEIELEMYIRRNITNCITLTQNTFFLNIKLQSDNITELSTLKHTLPHISEFPLLQLHQYNADSDMNTRINYMIEYFNSDNIIDKFEILEKILNTDYTFIDNSKFSEYHIEGDNYKTPYNSILSDPYHFTGIRFTIPNSYT